MMPQFARIQQTFDRTVCPDIAATVTSELSSLGLDLQGKTVALTAGSRGIANIALIIKTTVDWVAAQGGKPFIVPAMGSHGGATADGQLEVAHISRVSKRTWALS